MNCCPATASVADGRAAIKVRKILSRNYRTAATTDQYINLPFNTWNILSPSNVSKLVVI